MLLPFQPQPFLFAVPDWERGHTRFQQRVEWLGLSIDVCPKTKELMVELRTLVHPYGDDGAPLDTPVIAPRPVKLYAKNDTACYFNPAWAPTADAPTDPRNGEIISQQGGQGLAAWEAELDALPVPVMKQGDLFFVMMHYPAVLADLIRLEILSASLPPFSKFA